MEIDDALGDAAFFDMSLDHLCVAGFDGYWKRLNPAWSRTLGWTPQEMMAVPLIDFVHPDDRADTLGARYRLSAGVPLFRLTNRYRCRDGSYRWFEWRSSADVSRALVYAIARDVTAEREAHAELERLRRQLMLADRLASVGTLSAGVAHEIEPARPEAPPPSRTAAVLVVDDDPAVARGLADVMMPEMSGMDLHAALEPAVAARVVFMTGGAFTAASHEFLDRVPNDRLEKPFTAADVHAAIDRVLAGT